MNDLGYQGEGIFNAERVARRDHHCDICGGVIRAGTKYVRSVAAPFCPWTGGGWSTLKMHLRDSCPEPTEGSER